MAYNRCIGTRYCANNCPYKVRRFNFLDWNKEWRDARNKVRRLLFNPDVTVRMRGVMEKCTFCVQRIQNAKIKAKAEIRNGKRQGVVNGPLPTARSPRRARQACPTEAIVFGDLTDKTSRVTAPPRGPPQLRAAARDVHEAAQPVPRARPQPEPEARDAASANQGGHE